MNWIDSVYTDEYWWLLINQNVPTFRNSRMKQTDYDFSIGGNVLWLQLLSCNVWFYKYNFTPNLESLASGPGWVWRKIISIMNI